MEYNVHIGGQYDAEKLALSDDEYQKVQWRIHKGIELCIEINSSLVSLHPPIFLPRDERDEVILLKAKKRFRKLLQREVEL